MVIRYRNYTIEREHPPIPGVWYSFAHDDYDGAPDGNDPRCGTANSISGAKEAIDSIED